MPTISHVQLDEAILLDCVTHMGDIVICTGRKIIVNPMVGEVVGKQN